MARTRARPRPTQTLTLAPIATRSHKYHQRRASGRRRLSGFGGERRGWWPEWPHGYGRRPSWSYRGTTWPSGGVYVPSWSNVGKPDDNKGASGVIPSSI